MGSSSISSMLRLSGMSTGLDTDSIIQSLMTVEQTKVDRVFRQQTLAEWKLAAHKAINSQISAFRNANMSVLSGTNLFTTSAFNIFNVNLPTATGSVSLTAGAGAQAGDMQIDNITRIAKASSTASAAPLTAGSTVSLTAQLGSLELARPITFGGANADEVSFAINGETFTFKNTDTLQTVFNTINASSTINVSISYSELTNAIQIKTRDTGAATALTIENLTGNLFGADSAFAIGTGTIQNGQDALLSINGVSVTRSINDFTIDGVNYRLKSASAVPINFTVERNTDATVDKIKNYVTEYNKLVDALQSSVSEAVYRDYSPLTDAQKEEMSEKDIEAWETKAKSGLLRNDRNLGDLLGDLRAMLYETVAGTSLSLSAIGLRTGSYYDHGKISLDEQALRAALARDPDQVTRLFTQTSQSADPATQYAESGFLTRVNSAFTAYTKTYSLTEADQEIARLKQQVSDLTDQMVDKEEQYYKRFTAMETAISTMNAQSSWLTMQFSANSGK